MMLATLMVLAMAAADRPASAVQLRPLLPAYVCPDGSLIEVDEARGRAELRLGNATLTLALDRPGRYAAEGVAVEVDAETLRFHRGGRPGAGLARPADSCARRPPGPTDQAFWGQILWDDAPTLARVDLILADAARLGEGRPPLASTRIEPRAPSQPPLHFVLPLDPALLFPGIHYVLVARGYDRSGRLIAENTPITLFAEGFYQPPVVVTLFPPGSR